MKRLATFTACGVLAASWAVSTSFLAGAADEKAAAEAAAAGPIQLEECRIKLIDQVTLASDRPGVLKFVEPEEGDHVKKSQQVASLKDAVARAELAVARKKATDDVQVRYARKAKEVAEKEYEKNLQANKEFPGAVPDVEVIRSKLAAERAVLQIEKAQHDQEINKLTAEESEAKLETYQVVAPIDGIVTRVWKSEGEAVNQGDKILEVSSTDRVRVEGYLPIEDMWRVEPGSAVQVQLNVPEVELPVEDETFKGHIVFVDVAVEPVTRQVRVWAEVQNRENILRAGLTADMTIYPNQQMAAADNKTPADE